MEAYFLASTALLKTRLPAGRAWLLGGPSSRKEDIFVELVSLPALRRQSGFGASMTGRQGRLRGNDELNAG